LVSEFEAEMILDVRTVGLLSGVMPLALGIVMLTYWHLRRVYAGFGHWVISNFILGIGFLLIDTRDMIPDFFSIIVGNVLLVYAMLLVYEGLQLFMERPGFNLWNYVFLLFYIVLQIFFTYVMDAVNFRIVLVSAITCFYHFRMAVSLIRYMPERLRKTSNVIVILFMISALLALLRAVVTLLRATQTDLASDNFLFWYALVFLISVLSWTFCFFLLSSARLELDLEDAHKELTLIAHTDPLTGLFNRRYFFEHAEAEFKRLMRYRHGASLLMIDVDLFKNINDGFGHMAGDKILNGVATILREQLRAFDLVARLGGDEFIVMLLNVNEPQSFKIAERICKAVERTSVTFEDNQLEFRLSVGLTSLIPNEDDLVMAIQRADKALYQAKLEGRNRVSIA
jgi:diguanylate cyclase (GGDEF)-like protein